MPALSPVVETLDKVPEPARAFYELKDGKFVLSLDAAPPGFVSASDLASANARVVEFRDNNIVLQKAVDALKPLEAFKDLGVDAATARAAVTKVKELENKGVKNTEDIQALITAGALAAVKPVQDQLATAVAAIESERARADESVLRSAVSEKFLKSGGRPDALKFIMDLSRESFKAEGGTVKALPNKFSAVKPGDSLSIDEWMTTTMKDHAYIFEPSKGGGAGNNGSPGPSDGLKPGQTILSNPTPNQLGEFADDIRAGKMVVRHTEP